METKPPLPPFTLETAIAKVQAAENAWNTRDPDRVALAYTEVAKSIGIFEWTSYDPRVSPAQVGKRIRLSPQERTLVLYGQQNCRAV
jgi:Protein of unknown function (DUF1348)